ncbi:AzlC family ABC transporter permease [Tistrella sp. BH-R2-4]|uniref:AzlC family ABC transporter permease n=1 Tax=Tistrella arctica TaxID=3133430 RepID=A0ABU9YDG7_9PROT
MSDHVTPDDAPSPGVAPIPLKTAWLAGVKLALPIMVAYLSVAFSFGLLAIESGLPPWAAVAMSVLVYAGAAQFMAVALIAAGTAMPAVVLAVGVLNLRHMVMTLALPGIRPAVGRLGWPARMALYAGMTDEAFAAASFATAPAAGRPAALGTLVFAIYLSWIVGTAAGIAAGALVPADLRAAMAAGLYALFVALLVPGLKARPAMAWVVSAAAIVNAALSPFMPAGVALLLSILCVAGGYALIAGGRGPDATASAGDGRRGSGRRGSGRRGSGGMQR